MFGYTGLNIPMIDSHTVMPMSKKLATAIVKGLTASVHGIYRGGMATHLAFVAMTGNLGLEIDLGYVPTNNVDRNSHMLFSESGGRFIITVAPENRSGFEEIMNGFPVACVSAR